MLMLGIHSYASIVTVSVSDAVLNSIQELLQKNGFPPATAVNSISKAKRTIIDRDVDLIIIDVPLPDEDATQFAINLAKCQSFDYSIIMLIKGKQYDQTLFQFERMGIVALKKPLEPYLLIQTIRLLLSVRARIKKLENQTETLQNKLADDRLVNRAKILLIQQLKISEQDAHHYIEKKAMDACIKKTKVAQEIIRTYDPT